MWEEYNEIGENAGKIWRYLKEKRTEFTIQDLSKRMDMGIVEMTMAIGWLAREKNINIQRKGYLFYLSHLGY